MKSYHFSQNNPEFTLFSSNSAQKLTLALIINLKNNPLRDPFAKEYILVQTNGQQHWLDLKIARNLNISSNIEFLSSDDLLTKIFTDIYPENFKNSIFNKSRLLWAVFNLLKSNSIEKPELIDIKNYVASSDLKCYEISRTIADLFDQYIIYRPELILTWKKNQLLYKTPDEIWQKTIFTELINTYGNYHRLTQKKFLNEYLQKTTQKNLTAKINRISIFGLSTLSPFHLDLIKTLGQKINIFWFQLNPAENYWGDALTEKQLTLFAGKHLKKETNLENQHFEKTNSLLANLGTTGKNFHNALIEINFSEEHNLFSPPKNKNLLNSIQNNIYNLSNSKTSTEILKSKNLKPNKMLYDDSLQIISCHSKLREIEIMHNYLLNFFQTDAHFTPSDILVTALNIAEYQSHIEAVFSSVPDNLKIPFTIADKTFKKQSQVAASLLALFNFCQSRFTAEDVIELLYYLPISHQSGFSDSQINHISRLIADAGIRWGWDAQFKTRFNLPLSAENTFTLGFKNLIKNQNEEDKILIANFIVFCEKLYTLYNDFNQIETLNSWIRKINSLIETFISINYYTESEIRYITRSIENLSQSQRLSNFDKTLDFSVIKSFFKTYFSQKETNFNHLTGNVTFCSMIEAKNLPYKIIYILGLNDGVFPRNKEENSFNLLKFNPQPLDRNLRENDRYLFLETLLSAKEKLYLSYIGADSKDLSLIEPSIVISEILDYIGPKISSKIIIKHPLHSFSEKYFSSDPNLFSFQNIPVQASGCFSLNSSLSLDSPKNIAITLDDLISFFKNPAKHLLNNVLGSKFLLPQDFLETTELFEPDDLQNYQINKEILNYVIKNEPKDKIFNNLISSGTFSKNILSAAIFNNNYQKVKYFYDTKVKKYLDSPALKNIKINHEMTLDKKNIQITGELDNIYTSGQITLKPQKTLKAKNLIEAWLRHLFLNLYPQKSAQKTLLLSFDKPVCLKPLANPQIYLDKILNIYLQGILSFLDFAPSFIKSFWEQKQHKKTDSESIKKAIADWQDKYNLENQDIYFKLSFNPEKINFNDEEQLTKITALAETIFTPIEEFRENPK